ncbi:MAG: S8 family serine peptidase [Candidatus Eisenbacteria bacterium]
MTQNSWHHSLLIASLAVAFALPRGVEAGELSEPLAARLATLADGATTSAIVVLRDQVDLESLTRSLAARHTSRKEWHREVVSTLRARAEATQAPLRDALEAARPRGAVLGYTPYWIANLLVVEADRATLQAIAARADVAWVEANFGARAEAAPQGASRSAEGTGRKSARSVGITPGLRALRVDQVWSSLGTRGEGTLVASLDTGVDGNHPALAARWRGAGGSHPSSECWHDVQGGGTQFPFDSDGHGTHGMGTMAGAALGDSFGVAPAARWIAANPIGGIVGPTFDNRVIDSFQWMADPDGNANTVDDVPDVLENSWGVNEQLGYPDCDPRWYAVIDGCEASGVVVIWSAGGDGPAPSSIRSPADRATTATNTFSVGTVDCSNGATFPYALASFSSRGPTSCAQSPEFAKKPEVVAPGIGIYSCLPGNAYGVYSGSAMAGSHVAGVAALMRAANPDLPVNDVKRILLETARDEGSSGEDNNYGWGFVDAYAAVASALQAAASAESATSAAPWLGLAHPNPTRGTVRLRYRLPSVGEVAITVVDANGRRVRELLGGSIEAGDGLIRWDGRDDRGRAVCSGVYLLQLTASGFRGERRVLVLR